MSSGLVYITKEFYTSLCDLIILLKIPQGFFSARGVCVYGGGCYKGSLYKLDVILFC